MTDQPTTRDQLIEQAAQVLASLGADHLTADDYMTDARALADAGLLADPEQHAELQRLREIAEERNEFSLKLDGVTTDLRELTAERDALQARLDAALAFHVEYSIYADCGHADHDDDEDVVDLGDKYVCAEGYQYSVCLACCCDGDTGGQHEVCTDSHCPDERPNLCWPCPTRRALKDLAEPTGEVDRA